MPAKPSNVTELHDKAEAAADAAPAVTLFDHATLAEALVAALSNLTVVEAGRTAQIPTKAGGSYSYKYADLADVVKLTRRTLSAHGLVALTPVHAHGDDLACSVTLLHKSGERLDFEPLSFPHGADAQSTGSAITYHRRYALVAALGMAAGDDDDGAAAQPRQAPVKVEPHPLRAKAAELDDDGKVWAFFLSRAGVADQDADALLTEDEGWRRWLSEGIAAHLAAGGDPPKDQDATDG